MTGLPVGFPSGPLIDPATGELTPSWRAFFLAMFLRTGGTAGVITTDTSSLSAAIAAETTARQTADAGLTSSIAQERSRAEVAEQALSEQLRVQIYQTQQMIGGLGSAYVLKTQLASLWAQQDYRFLPVTDPGNGRPWLDGHIAVGTGGPILLENLSGHWLLEDGTGDWAFG